MKTIAIILLAFGLTIAAARAALPVQASFSGAKSQQTWALRDLSDNLPSDWTGYEFLVLEFMGANGVDLKT